MYKNFDNSILELFVFVAFTEIFIFDGVLARIPLQNVVKFTSFHSLLTSMYECSLQYFYTLNHWVVYSDPANDWRSKLSKTWINIYSGWVNHREGKHESIVKHLYPKEVTSLLMIMIEVSLNLLNFPNTSPLITSGFGAVL